MLAPERKRLRTLEKNKRRQQSYRERQLGKGLGRLQVYTSVYSHYNARLVADRLGVDLTTVYIEALQAVDPERPPAKHDEVLEGDLIGIMQICPWLPLCAIARFEEAAKHYKTRTIAMSAILADYAQFKH